MRHRKSKEAPWTYKHDCGNCQKMQYIKYRDFDGDYCTEQLKRREKIIHIDQNTRTVWCENYEPIKKTEPELRPECDSRIAEPDSRQRV